MVTAAVSQIEMKSISVGNYLLFKTITDAAREAVSLQSTPTSSHSCPSLAVSIVQLSLEAHPTYPHPLQVKQGNCSGCSDAPGLEDL